MVSPSDRLDARAKRVVLQKLQSLYAAGVRHLPRAKSIDEGDVTAQTTADTDAQTPQSYTPLKGESDMARRAGTNKTPELIATAKSSPPETSLSLAGRQQQLQILAQSVSGCRRCAELADMRTQTVFGVGNPLAKIMFIGEAPGADEESKANRSSAGQGSCSTRLSKRAN